MAISRTIQNALSKGDFDTIEDEWLSHSSEKPEDLDYFVGVARALSGQGEGDRARFLLELLDDSLADKGLWRIRLKMLHRVGHLLFDVEELHESILESLQGIHGEHSSYKMLVDKSGLLRAPKNVAKTWEKVERFRNLMSFDVGTVVFMEGKGAGRITEINTALDSFRIDFEIHQGLMVGFRAAGKMLQPLEEDHLLYRKLENPDELKAMADDDPGKLLRLALVSYDGPRTGAEIRTDLEGIVPKKRWTSWWASARKNPQVLTSAKGRQTYTWADSTEDASDAVWDEMVSAKTLSAKVDLFRRNAPRDEKLRDRMAEHLLEATGSASPSEAFEIWYALERVGCLPEEDLAWAPDKLLRDANYPAGILGALQDRPLRERGYELLREIRDDWPDIYLDLLNKETETRSLELLASAVEDKRPQELSSFIEKVMSQPSKHPSAFVWLAEKAADDEELLQRSPLRFLQQIFVALQDGAFASVRAARLVPLVESGGTVPRLLDHLTEDHAEQALEAIARAAGLEDYQRDGLRNAVELRFASLRKEDEAPLYALPASIEEKRKEFQHLKSVEIPENRQAIEEARALGDLRENFEYKSARQRHEYLNARLAGLNHDLSRVHPIDLSRADASEVRLGSKVFLKAEGGDDRSITILGPWESKPEEDVISYESELAQKIIGKKAGDEVSLGDVTYTVESIKPFS